MGRMRKELGGPAAGEVAHPRAFKHMCLCRGCGAKQLGVGRQGQAQRSTRPRLSAFSHSVSLRVSLWPACNGRAATAAHASSCMRAGLCVFHPLHSLPSSTHACPCVAGNIRHDLLTLIPQECAHTHAL